MNKRILIIFLLFAHLSGAVCATEDVLKGRIESKEGQSELFVGTFHKLDKKDVVKMTVSKILDTNLIKEDDEFFAEVVEDVEADDGIVIPQGSLAHGKIVKVKTAKRLGRHASLDLVFDYLVTPDGREIPIEGKMTTRKHPAVEASSAIGTNIVYTLAGGTTGGLLALNLFGIGGAISTQGTTIAAGAAFGGTIGLGASLYSKGKDVLISQEDEIQVKISTPTALPVYKKEAFFQQELSEEGLGVKINNVAYKESLYGNVDIIELSLSVSNKTNKTFSIFDLTLANNFNTVYYPDVFSNDKLYSLKIAPGAEFSFVIPFCVDNVKNKFWLIFSDKKKVAAKISVDNAYKQMDDKDIKQNERILGKKKNFYKDVNFYNNF